LQTSICLGPASAHGLLRGVRPPCNPAIFCSRSILRQITSPNDENQRLNPNRCIKTFILITCFTCPPWASPYLGSGLAGDCRSRHTQFSMRLSVCLRMGTHTHSLILSHTHTRTRDMIATDMLDHGCTTVVKPQSRTLGKRKFYFQYDTHAAYAVFACN
jgi:hypothetical protein